MDEVIEPKRYRVLYLDVRTNENVEEEFDILWVAIRRACSVKNHGWAVQVTIKDTCENTQADLV